MGQFFQPTPGQIKAFVTKHFQCKLRKNDTEFNFNCPFDGDTGRNFSVGTNGFCHDWRGDSWAPVNPRSGKRNTSFVAFVCKFLGCTYRAALKAIAQGTGDVLPSLRPDGTSRVAEEVKEKPLVDLPGGSFKLLESPEPRMSALIRRWLATRGVGEEQIRKYDIHHCGGHAVWPYYEFDLLVYWQSRAATTKEFMFPSEDLYKVTKGQFFYNFDNVEPASYAAIVEAIFGALTLEDQVLASGGAALTPQQVKKLKLLGPREGVILAPDNDGAGIESIVANATLLQRSGFRVYYSLPPKIDYQEDGTTKFTKDWNELLKAKLTKQEIRSEFEKDIRPYNTSALVSLMSLASAAKKAKKHR